MHEERERRAGAPRHTHAADVYRKLMSSPSESPSTSRPVSRADLTRPPRAPSSRPHTARASSAAASASASSAATSAATLARSASAARACSSMSLAPAVQLDASVTSRVATRESGAGVAHAGGGNALAFKAAFGVAPSCSSRRPQTARDARTTLTAQSSHASLVMVASARARPQTARPSAACSLSPSRVTSPPRSSGALDYSWMALDHLEQLKHEQPNPTGPSRAGGWGAAGPPALPSATHTGVLLSNNALTDLAPLVRVASCLLLNPFAQLQWLVRGSSISFARSRIDARRESGGRPR
jgi:hypothetical protein